MNPQEFKRMLQKKQSEINRFVNITGPKLVGKTAVDYFKHSFIRGRFNGNKWKAPQRFNENGNTADEKYGTLRSATNELMNSITYSTEPGKVIVSSDKVYARIHNYGGKINVPVTDKMRKFAWAKHYEAIKDTDKKESKWKGLALTKKESLEINMPQRQFMGDSLGLERVLEYKLKQHLTKILNN